MIIRNIAGTVTIVAALGVLSKPSLAASFRDIGANCIVLDARADNNIPGSRSCSADAGTELTRGSGICGGQIIRNSSGVAYFTALTRIRAAQQNICAKTNAFLPVSYLLPVLP